MESVGSSLIGVQVAWLLWEEVGTETLVGVEEDSVDVVVELSGDVLGKELDLVDVITTLGSLGGGGLSALLVPHLHGIRNVSWLDSGDVEAGSESVGAVIW